MSRLGQVRLEGVVKSHGRGRATSIDLAIEPGEFFALLGPSGSGKTTTLRIIAGLEEVSAARSLIDGVDVTDAAARRARRRDGVPELRPLSAHDRGAEHRLPAEDGRHGAGRDRARGAEAAGKVEIDHLLDRRPGSSPAASSSAVALARAIVRQPRLFLLDEPLSNLDAKLRLETRVELHKLQRSLGVTTVYVTHDQEEAMTIADRIAVFMEGRIVQVGTPREIFGGRDARGRRLHRHAADEPAAGRIGPGDHVRVGRARAGGRRRPAGPRGDARRSPRRHAHRRRRHRGDASSVSRTSATAPSSACLTPMATC